MYVICSMEVKTANIVLHQDLVSKSEVKVLTTQQCLTLCDSMFYIAHQAPLSMEFSRQGYWSGLPVSSPGVLLNPGKKPGSAALQADSLPSEPPVKSYRETPCIGNAKKTLAALWYACLPIVPSTPPLNNKKINVSKLPVSLEKCSPLFSFLTLLVKQ